MFFVWTLVLHSPFINYDWLRNELFMRSTNQMQNLNLFNRPCFSALKQFAFFRHEFSVAHHDYFSLWFVALIKCSFTIIIQKALQNDCSLVFYRAFARLHVFTLSSLVMFTCHLIGWCKYFEFGFAAPIENALCRVFGLYSWVVGYSHKKSSVIYNIHLTRLDWKKKTITIHDISLGGGAASNGVDFLGGYLVFRGKGRESVVANRVIM